LKVIKPKLNIKKVIKAKLELAQKPNQTKPILNKKAEKKVTVERYKSVYNQFTKSKKDYNEYTPSDRLVLIENYRALYESIKKPGQKRLMDVDYDVIVCISSYNRFEKIDKLLSMFYEQKSKYSFKIILMNDGSDDVRYETLKKKYPLLDYQKNAKNNGRRLYWYTVTQLWQRAKINTSNTLLMIDDDFLLCSGFLDTICDFYFWIKEENDNVAGIAPHLHSYLMGVEFMSWWYNAHSVDGICLFDRKFIESFDHKLEPVSEAELHAVAHAHGWSQLQNKILRENRMAYKTRYSLVYHDGNDESKMGASNARKTKAFTYYFKKDGVNFKDLKV